jgi:hypothetical protein
MLSAEAALVSAGGDSASKFHRWYHFIFSITGGKRSLRTHHGAGLVPPQPNIRCPVIVSWAIWFSERLTKERLLGDRFGARIERRQL